MRKRHFGDLLGNRHAQQKFVCVGLDTDYEKMPAESKNEGSVHLSIADFNEEIVEATCELAGAYKPNIAFYEAHGAEGWNVLKQTIEFIRMQAPEIPVILDCKRGDIGNTNKGYLSAAFDYFSADAVTVNPYFGKEALQPFLDCEEKGIIVLCKTSNPGSGEFQDMFVTSKEFLRQEEQPLMMKLYQFVAYQVADKWNAHGNCGLVVGATYPEELATVRKISGDMPILIPGVGKQGGDVAKVVKAGANSHGKGMIINSSSGIIFASSGKDFAEAARIETLKLHEEIVANLSKETEN